MNDFYKELYSNLPWRDSNEVPKDVHIGIHTYLWLEELKKNPKRVYRDYTVNFSSSYKDIILYEH